jgi:hypothetical protein
LPIDSIPTGNIAASDLRTRTERPTHDERTVEFNHCVDGRLWDQVCKWVAQGLPVSAVPGCEPRCLRAARVLKITRSNELILEDCECRHALVETSTKRLP